MKVHDVVFTNAHPELVGQTGEITKDLGGRFEVFWSGAEPSVHPERDLKAAKACRACGGEGWGAGHALDRRDGRKGDTSCTYCKGTGYLAEGKE